ncbi:hypothetical protein OAT67_04320 [Bacteriovoracaceae bacterium]|nr:hypothetical protein [Bacteriovoracaceae bacterium]
MMHCPTCFNNSLHFDEKGVIEIIINKKQMDAGRIIYNLDPREKEKMFVEFKRKVEEFFKWYSTFQNKEPLCQVELVTASVKCDSGCKIPPNLKSSVIDSIISSSLVREEFEVLAKKYHLEIELKI